ncbi:AraC family transcriptional regulator [Enterococcus sp. AZ178]|uniref:AraC family transcriptional regulator n=1 Tax=Enterococcus sp. AZ178 TaxID=2774822 RepID=UPI003F687541
MKDFDKKMRVVTETEMSNLAYLKNQNGLLRENEKPVSFLQHAYDFSLWYPEEIYFKKNSRWAAVKEHRHNYIEMSYAYDGKIRQLINGNEVILKKNDVLILDVNTIHAIDYTDENDILLNYSLSKNMFSTNFFDLFSEKNIIMNFLIQALYENQQKCSYLLFRNCSEDILFLLKKLAIEIINDEPEKNLVTTDLLRLIFVELIRSQHSNIVADSHRVDLILFQAKIAKYIEVNIRDISLEKAAKNFGYNYAYFSQRIKQVFGKKWTDLVQEIRIRCACELLVNTSLTIKEIAVTVGIENSSFFYRMFRTLKGVSPREYRLQTKK